MSKETPPTDWAKQIRNSVSKQPPLTKKEFLEQGQERSRNKRDTYPDNFILGDDNILIPIDLLIAPLTPAQIDYIEAPANR